MNRGRHALMGVFDSAELAQLDFRVPALFDSARVQGEFFPPRKELQKQRGKGEDRFRSGSSTCTELCNRELVQAISRGPHEGSCCSKTKVAFIYCTAQAMAKLHDLHTVNFFGR